MWFKPIWEVWWRRKTWHELTGNRPNWKYYLIYKRQEIWTVKTPLNNDNNCTNSRYIFFCRQLIFWLVLFLNVIFILFFFPSIIWFNSSQVENTGFRSWCGLRCLSRDSSGRRQRAAPTGPPPTPPPHLLLHSEVYELSSGNGLVWRAHLQADPGTAPGSLSAWSTSPPVCPDAQLRPLHPTERGTNTVSFSVEA